MTKHVLIKSDAMKVLSKFPHEYFDAIIVDPPYNTANKNTKILKGRKDISMDFGKWDYFEDEEFLKFSYDWINEAKDSLKSCGNLLVFVKLEYVSDIRRIYEKLGFNHHGTIIWHKTNPTPKIRKTGFLSACEAILWATKGFDDSKVPYTFNFSKQNEMHNFIQTPICMGKQRTKHPTQKPEKVYAHLLKIFSNENDNILDCFAGAGTLAAVGIEMKRNTVCIEQKTEYFKFMEDRIKAKFDLPKYEFARRINILKTRSSINEYFNAREKFRKKY